MIANSKVIRSLILRADVSIGIRLARLGAFRDALDSQIDRAFTFPSIGVADLTIGIY
jgi:hypothetical protein